MLKIKKQHVRLPTIIIPYNGPILKPGAQDVFLYLRPESNGVLVESLLLKVAQSRTYADKCEVVYLANMPGDFIVKNKIIEQHNRTKIRFAKMGKQAFTPHMKDKFERYFQKPFKTAPIIGSFAAKKKLDITYEELFSCWVPPYHYAVINGQSIKYFKDYYIVNYDIPAILHKNSRKTDIAVMIFRSVLTSSEFYHMVEEMREALIKREIISEMRPLARTFHYSSGPFEQLLDGIGYLYNSSIQHLRLESLSYALFLIENNIDKIDILEAIRNPIMRFQQSPDKVIEENLFTYTNGNTYHEALMKFETRITKEGKAEKRIKHRFTQIHTDSHS